MTDAGDQAAKNQLIQNCLVMIGIATAAEMSQAGHMVILDGLGQVMNYLLSPEKALERVAPIYG
jgi:hypothetical protein